LPRVGRICANRRRHPCRLSWRPATANCRGQRRLRRVLKLCKVAKPGHRPDTSTIRPCSTPNPASRSAVLNSSEVICGFLRKAMGAIPSRWQPCEHPPDLCRMPMTAARRSPDAARVERPSNPIQTRNAARLQRFDDGGKLCSSLVGARRDSFAGGTLSRWNDAGSSA